MISMGTAVLLVWVHTLADFFLQTDNMAVNKSSSNKWLLFHVSVYGGCLLPFGGWYALLNAFLHFWTDYCTSRMTTRLWKARERHWFFVVIGVDQALHVTSLFLTYRYAGW